LTSTLNKQVKKQYYYRHLEHIGGDTPREDHTVPSTSSKVTRKDVDQMLKMLMGNIHLNGNQ